MNGALFFNDISFFSLLNFLPEDLIKLLHFCPFSVCNIDLVNKYTLNRLFVDFLNNFLIYKKNDKQIRYIKIIKHDFVNLAFRSKI